MNLKRLMYKMQTALLCKGIKVKINQFQSYSEESKRMITKYVLTVPKQEGDKIKNEKLLESYRPRPMNWTETLHWYRQERMRMRSSSRRSICRVWETMTAQRVIRMAM